MPPNMRLRTGSAPCNRNSASSRSARSGSNAIALCLAPGLEESAQEIRAIIGQDAGADLRAPVTGGLFEEAGTMLHGPALLVGRPEDDAPDPGMADSAGAHGTRLQRDKKLQPGKPVIAASFSRLAQDKDFSMSGWIMPRNRRIMRLRDDLVRGRINEDGPNRRFARLSCCMSEA